MTAPQSAIIYACVANKDIILAEYSARSGNYSKVVKRILEQIPQHDNKMSYVFEKHYFHYSVSEGLTYLCMAEESFGRRIPFAFLDDIQQRFKSTYGDRAKTTTAYAMQSEFSRVLQKQMDYYSNNANADRILSIQKGLDDVKGIMVNNIERVLERGERIELLVDRTEDLNASAVQFKKKSNSLKQAMWWQNAKVIIAIVVVVIVVIIIIVLAICIPGNFCAGSPPPAPLPNPVPTITA